MKIYQKPKEAETRWINFENKLGKKGKGGIENKGAKGHAFERFQPGMTATLMDYEGQGIVNKIWLTINNRRPETLNSVIIRIYWDYSERPAVEAPLGDFFCANKGQLTAFENEYFSSPEGRSFNCFIPMPFRKHAKITLTNNSDVRITLFYDISVALQVVEEDALYFHAVWNREENTKCGVDYTALPKLSGEGKLLGISFGIKENECYKDSWFGEGEVKIYVDGDQDLPTLVGTGIEDYIGTAWGQGKYIHRYQGCLKDGKEDGIWTFYKFNVTDPVYFNQDMKISVQVIGGAQYRLIKELQKENVDLIPVTVDIANDFIKLLEIEKDVNELDLVDANWVNFYRSDDYSTVTYLYLNKPDHSQ